LFLHKANDDGPSPANTPLLLNDNRKTAINSQYIFQLRKKNTMISKRTFLSHATALFVSASFAVGPALAQGGDDPIPGIDIIVKKDPGSQPVMDTSFDRGSLANLNEMKGQDRPKYITSVVYELTSEVGFDRSFREDLHKALSSNWSEKYRPEETTINARSDDGEQRYTVTVVIKGER
jgi:hypothetical protein